MIVPISQIFFGRRQRKLYDEPAIQALARDIEARGLLHPVVLRPPHPGEETGGCPYVLMAGGRRTLAHVMLGRSEVEARLKGDLSPLDARIAELNENVIREDLTWQEEVDARNELAELHLQQHPTLTMDDLAAEIGISKGQLSKDMALHKAIKSDPSLKHADKKGTALRTHALKLVVNERVEKLRATDGNRIQTLTSKLLTADASQFTRMIPDASVDLVFGDLPYGIDYFERVESGGKGKYDDSEDTSKDFITDIVPQLLRVCKPSGWVVLFMCYEWHAWLQELLRDTCRVHWGYRHHEEHGIECCNQVPYDGLEKPYCEFPFAPELPPWIWTRRGAGNHGHHPELHSSNRYEVIVVVNAGSGRLLKKPSENVLDFAPFSGERLHDMQKPHDLCREIIERCSLVGELVYDPCFGSGAHLAAAASLGRDFLGCDSNPRNLQSAISLVSQHYTPKKTLSLK